MPRRNTYLLCLIVLLALVCHLRVDRHGRHLAYALTQISQRYLEEVDERDLFEGAVEGMINRLDDKFDDKYSSYIPPGKVKEFEEDLNQQFGGVGIEVGLSDDTKQLTVISPLVGSPAYEAGVRPGDRIQKIDGRSTQGLSLLDAVQRMRGELGTPVTLTLLHAGETSPTDLTIVRAEIHADTVLGDARNSDGSWDYFLAGHDRIGYVRIAMFTENTADQMRSALRWLSERQMRGLVLDLRGNPGGYLDSAVQICDMFLSSGVIVTTRGRGGRLFHAFEATGQGTYTDFPLAVLVNQSSASASEIVAGCLQDHHRAVIVGQRTYGKGTVQEILGLQPGCGMMKLTTAEYGRPSGRNINRGKRSEKDADWGVSPDPGCEVPLTTEALVKLLEARRRRDAAPVSHAAPSSGSSPAVPEQPADPQLEKAVEYVEEGLAAR